MQEIKFRGKRADSGEWVYGYFVLEDNDVNTIITVEGVRHLVIAGTVSQYINIKDENGKEIYEGNWLKWNKYFFRVSYDYLNGYWYGEPHVDNSLPGMLAGRSFPDSKIIDNISDNPELIKKK